MRTSTSQFDVLVTFMEQHGDLSKPSSNARGRISCIKYWEQLTEILNSDGTGDTKTTEKWKKVWSDFKNNTKKKAARIHRAASGTGGGPAVYAKLTELELRVLKVIGKQAATGLSVEEAGVSQVIHSQLKSDGNRQATHTPQTQFLEIPLRIPMSPASLHPSGALVEEEVPSPQYWNEPGPSSYHPVPSPPEPRSSTAPPLSYADINMADTGNLTPIRPSSQAHVVLPEPARSGQTTPRRARVVRSRGSPRRRPRLAHTELAAQHFLQSEENWRKFKQLQHKDYMDMRREKNRIRELELETQRRWQSLGERALDLIEKIVNKYC